MALTLTLPEWYNSAGTKRSMGEIALNGGSDVLYGTSDNVASIYAPIEAATTNGSVAMMSPNSTPIFKNLVLHQCTLSQAWSSDETDGVRIIFNLLTEEIAATSVSLLTLNNRLYSIGALTALRAWPANGWYRSSDGSSVMGVTGIFYGASGYPNLVCISPINMEQTTAVVPSTVAFNVTYFYLSAL